MAHACNPIVLEAEEGRQLRIPGQPGLQNETLSKKQPTKKHRCQQCLPLFLFRLFGGTLNILTYLYLAFVIKNVENQPINDALVYYERACFLVI